jgi:type II secretory pathway component PulM
MRDWFESLEARERLFVSIGAAIVAIALFWGLIWAPLDNGHSELQQRVATWERSLAELRPLASMPQPQSGSRPASAPNGIRVEFENVAFDKLVVWLGDLSSQYGMEVQAGSLSAASNEAPGRIDATLTLERSL